MLVLLSVFPDLLPPRTPVAIKLFDIKILFMKFKRVFRCADMFFSLNSGNIQNTKDITWKVFDIP